MKLDYSQDPLRHVLNAAYQQAMTGKGKERHGDEGPFNEQVWKRITKACGLGFPVGQAMKKDEERGRMVKEDAIKELLGGIVYLSMAIITLIDGGKE